MSSERGPIRISQSIHTYVPGAIYIDQFGAPLLLHGCNSWFKKFGTKGEFTKVDNIKDFQILEPRISNFLNINHFRRMIEYRTGDNGADRFFPLPASRFPAWYMSRHKIMITGEFKSRDRNTTIPIDGKYSKMIYLNPDQANLFDTEKKFKEYCNTNHPNPANQNPKKTKALDRKYDSVFRAVRFLAVCPRGHLSEFPWKKWCGCTCADRQEKLYISDKSGSSLSSVKLLCTKCNHYETLEGITYFDDLGQANKLINSKLSEIVGPCGGEKPWLFHSKENCDQPLVGTLVNATNVTISKVFSGLYLPPKPSEENILSDLMALYWTKFSDCTDDHIKIKFAENMDSEITDFIYEMKDKHTFDILPTSDRNRLITIIKKFLSTGEAPGQQALATDVVSFRHEEYERLSNSSNDKELVVEKTKLGADHFLSEAGISNLSLVKKVRITRVSLGFVRFRDNIENNRTKSIQEQASRGLELFFDKKPQPDTSWLPASVEYGEGIFIKFNQGKITGWITNNKEQIINRVQDVITRLQMNYRFQSEFGFNTDFTEWVTFLLLHSFSHILIKELVHECGYGSAALRERIYVSCSNTTQTPMSGIFIYTASGDLEGGLGGLVDLGNPDKIKKVIEKALIRASWCSSDPVCSELPAQGPRKENMAACHSCLLLPETACETFNSGLDRALLMGTPTKGNHNIDQGFFSEIMKMTEYYK